MGAELSVLQPCNEQKQAFGTEITLKYAKGNLLTLNVTGHTIQSGTGNASFDNARPIHGVTKVTVNSIDYSTTRELFDEDAYNFISGSGLAKKVKHIFNGSGDYWTLYADGTDDTYLQAWAILPGSMNTLGSNLLCDKLSYHDYTDLAEGFYGGTGSTECAFFIKVLKSRLATPDISGLNSFISSDPITVVYPLATPLTITGTPQTIPVTMPTTITNDNSGQMVVIYPAVFECLGTTSWAFACDFTHELMRMYQLKFNIANKNSVFPYVTSDVLIEAKGQLFDLSNYEMNQGNDNTTSVQAQHVGYRTNNYLIPIGYSFVGTIAQIAADMLNVAVDKDEKKANTEFSIGTTPNLGTVSFSLQNTDTVTLRYAIMALKNVGAESDYDNFTINFAEKIGGGQTEALRFGINLQNVKITYDKTNGTTYEVNIADLQKVPGHEGDKFDIGYYGSLIDIQTQKVITKRIINYTERLDDPRQNKITLGVFVSDVSTQTAQMQVAINSSVQQGLPYNGVDVSHQYGFRSTSGDGNMRVLSNGTQGFVIQHLVSGNWVTIWEAESTTGKTVAYSLDHSQKVEMGGDYGYTTWASTDHGTTWTQTGGQGADGNVEAGKLISTLFPLISAAIGQFTTPNGNDQGLGIQYNGNTELALAAYNGGSALHSFGPFGYESFFQDGSLAEMYTYGGQNGLTFVYGNGSSYGSFSLKADGLHCGNGKNASFTIGGETFNVVDGIIRQ